tara:strand:- start:20 stop:691 length:672 start_codon:yes stop_codon:yes gene_type:complete
MDLSDLKKYVFPENSKINVIANRIMDIEKNNIVKENLKYLNFFNDGHIPKEVINYFFLISLSTKNIFMLLDTENLLNGQILDNFYNNLISEDSLLLLFLKFKIYCASEFNKLVPKKDMIQEILMKKISKYENLFEYEKTDLLIKNLDVKVKNKLLLLEVKKFRVANLSFQLILSYYFFKLKVDNNITNFENFISKVEDITDLFINNNLNSSLDEFWNHLITNI